MELTYSHTAHTTKFCDHEVPFVSFPALSQFNWLTNGFSTRLGGVSTDIYASMNLSFTRGDSADAVLENFHRIGNALQISVEDMLMSDQTHTANVLRVDGSKKGMGILRERDFHDVDGMITNEPGLCLVTSHADCVPVYFIDPVHRAIGLSHAGWKGTLYNIVQNTVNAMHEAYESNPAELITVIGPSICKSCYEVSTDVAEQFATVYGSYVFDTILSPEMRSVFSENNQKETLELIEGKFLLNLWEANRTNLLRAGVPATQIHITDLCTCCNPAVFHSHRASKGLRGGQCAFLQIRY